MIRYVVGFCFSPCGRRVVLIRKNRPVWQAGRFNGVGGKIEGTESIYEAMEREFREEAGVTIPAGNWEHYAILAGEDWSVYVMRVWSVLAVHASTQEDEQISIWKTKALPEDAISNLRWLIPLALDADIDRSPTLTMVTYGPKKGD